MTVGTSPSAQAIIEALTCGRSGCKCTSSVRRGRGLVHCPCASHSTPGDPGPSLSVTTAKDGTVLVKCFGGCTQHEVIAALRERGLWPRRVPRQNAPRGYPVRRWITRDADGTPVATHCRRDLGNGEKDVWWDGGLNGRPLTSLPLYGTERLNGAKAATLCEGEPATDALLGLGLPAVGTVTGAEVTPDDVALRPLLGLDSVFLWPDADDVGREHMRRIAARLVALGHGDVRMIEWPDAPPKGDAYDFIANGGSADDVLELAKAAVRCSLDAHISTVGTYAEDEHLTPRAFNLVSMSDVEPQAVRWLWRDRIPYDGLTLIDGDPGTNKTTIMLDVAARLSTGRPMPEGTAPDAAADVVVLTVEDVLATTIRPRLEVAGADLSRVRAFTGISDGDDERPVVLPGDWPAVIAAVEQTGARLVILDPLMALLGAEVNSYRDQDVRRALVAGIRAAERLGFALLVSRHLTKGEGRNALYRGGGSIGIVAAARSAMLAALDPDDETGTRRVLAMTKHNLAARADSLAYDVENVTLMAGIETIRLRWQGASHHQARDLLANQDVSDGEDTALGEAKEFLRVELADGPVPAGDIKSRSRSAGHSDSTIRRAKEELGIRSVQVGSVAHGGHWAWKLPNVRCSRPDEHLKDEHLKNADSGGQNAAPESLGVHTRAYEHLKAAKDESSGRCNHCGGPVDRYGLCLWDGCDGVDLNARPF